MLTFKGSLQEKGQEKHLLQISSSKGPREGRFSRYENKRSTSFFQLISRSRPRSDFTGKVNCECCLMLSTTHWGLPAVCGQHWGRKGGEGEIMKAYTHTEDTQTNFIIKETKKQRSTQKGKYRLDCRYYVDLLMAIHTHTLPTSVRSWQCKLPCSCNNKISGLASEPIL